MKPRHLLFAAVASLPLAATACPPPTSLTGSAIRQNFTETRSLTGLPTPLRSTGQLVVTPGQVEWHTTTPFNIDTFITATGMTQSIDDGPAQQVATGNNGMDAQITGIVASLMQGRWNDLRTMFQIIITQTNANQNWRVTLHPLDAKLAGFLGNITVEGCTGVTSFQLTQPNGDTELIAFTPAPP